LSHIISIHEYELKPGVDETEFEQVLQRARDSGLLQLPGLVGFHFLKGLRGVRSGAYAAIWIYESLEAWEALWGPVDQPISKEQYLENWKIWENEFLAPFLDRDPDRITYTAYQEI